MTAPAPPWPSEHVAPDAAAHWVASVCGRSAGPAQVLRAKSWGLTARFGAVVFKASWVPLFPQVAAVHAVLERVAPTCAPRLLACETVGDQLWTLFEHVPGNTAEEEETTDALVGVARTLATVQRAAAGGGLGRMPALDVRRVPSLLLDDLADQPRELVDWLQRAQPGLMADAEALAAVPRSLDHPDVNPSNAILVDDARVVLLDWEEATAGCPLFSLERLLQDAHRISAVEPVVQAYLDAWPALGRADLDRAMRLVPLKLAAEARAFARALGWPHPHTRYTNRLLEQARRRSLPDAPRPWLG